mmetsp:Transcript_32830/g.91930  ORF Transcript_32830/g.91930 Transcript_32830/m.91930 type:complete len:277 (+) Transcript_32830:86-916(+)|eukprot:CAMPEP_0119130882 /NCGR_PEP_ID=MMETSP1310-20130426/9010_1 /TAXON_ID=464262 /ORGANISM="Genus nov. species nov., Strain RCC2339" /LENGTH=276 /DNA_ID=CAMNT_0007121421 /DNA_START=55 /DNA_END=885 /DNA_ORIENTATION=+
MNPYPPQGGGYPPQQGGYPPQQGGYPPQAGYQQGGYPPQAGGYPPQQGGYPPQAGGYPPQAGRGAPGGMPGYPQQSGYPPQQSMYGGPQGGHLTAYGQQYYNQIDQSRMLELQGAFASVDKDRSGHITATELTNLQFGGKKFGLATAKKLLKVFDVDGSGSISFQEYAALHQFVMSMQGAFFQFDRDRSGKLDKTEVTQALVAGGFQLTQKTVDDLIKKFKQSQQRFAAQGLDFEQFLQMSSYLGQVRSTFMVYDTNRSGWINLNLEQLVQISTAL